MKSKTLWREKLGKPQQPKLVQIPHKMSRFGKGTMLIPTPMLVDELVAELHNTTRLEESLSQGF